MKPFHKALAAFLAVILIVSAAGCGNISLSKQWSYKYSDKSLDQQYDIGVYIYSLYQAYNSAKTYAEKAKGYKENESFMDLEIKDDDGKKAKASDWTKDEAKKNSLNLVALDYLCATKGATWDEASMKDADSQAKDTWEMGPYASYGYYQPQKDELEKYGVSLDSFRLASYEANVKQTALFKKLYEKGGLEEVSDKELTDFILKDYVGYSYIPVKLYTETQAATETEAAKTEKFKDKKLKDVKSGLEALAKEITDGSTTLDKAVEKAVKDYSVTDADVKKNEIDLPDNIKNDNEDVNKALESLKAGEAKVITVGEDGDSPMAYIVVKNEIKNKDAEAMVKDAQKRSDALNNMKKDDLKDLLTKTGEDLKKSDSLEINEGAINSYDPGMFFVKQEETKAADAAKSDDSDDSDDSSDE